MKILPALLIGLVVLAAASADNQKPEPKADANKLPQPVVDAHELMEIFNENLHHDLQEKMAQQPENARAWKLLARQGYRAAEIANLVALRNPQDKHAELWDKLSAEAQQAGIKLAEAAKKQDWQAARTAYQAIIQNCNSCHQQVDPDHAPTIKP